PNRTENQGTFVNRNASDVGGRGVRPLERSIDLALSCFTVVVLVITMVSLGCSMEVSKMKAHILKPKGIGIALLAQFFIMPLTAFSLSKVLQLSPIKAVTVLIAGCCPGGTLSNIFSLALKGDLNLSIVMTTVSSIAGLALMPLLLFIYSRGFPGLEKAVPYTGIIYSLIMTLLPCCVGIAINYYKPNYSPYVKKVGIGILIVSGVIIFALAYVSVGHLLWMIVTPDILTAAALLPAIGFALGYLLSYFSRVSSRCCRTISMETGCQNIQLCTTILKVSFDLEVIGPMFLFPLLYITTQCCEALLLSFQNFMAVCVAMRQHVQEVINYRYGR
uniref:Hepatic sodium/bile acid cotransporter n=1 Tax=Salarias fasciatus TaxID=181472 RepID=A0A672GBG0_SALFA